MGNEILCCLVHQVKTSSKPTGVSHSCFCNFLPPSYSNIVHVSLHLLLPMCVYDIDSTFLENVNGLIYDGNIDYFSQDHSDL